MRPIYYLLYHLIAKHLPASHCPYACGAKQVRAWLGRRLLAHCGRDINIEQGADIGTGRATELGDYSGIGLRCVVKHARIGKQVLMGPEVVFISQNHRFSDLEQPVQNQGYTESPMIEVGDNAWIGTRAIILPGRKIGRNAIVGAGAVVTKDVPDNAIVGGNPAQLIRYRDEPSNQTKRIPKAVVIGGDHVSCHA